MTIKTVQVLDITYPLDMSPGLDRLAHPDPLSRVFLTDMVNRGELPRYRGAEVQFETTAETLTITMEWKTRGAAQEYVDYCQLHQGAYLQSINLIET